MTVFKRGLHLGSYGQIDDGTALFERVSASVQLAEQAGFDAISVPDHMHQNGTGGGPTSPMFEAFSLLGALAAGCRQAPEIRHEAGPCYTQLRCSEQSSRQLRLRVRWCSQVGL